MELEDITRKKLEAVQFLLSYPDAFSAGSLPLSGVGITTSPNNQEDYQLLFHLDSEGDRELVGELCSKLDIQDEPVIEITGQAFSLPGISPLDRVRPLSVGSCVSPENPLASGTLGCFVRKKADDKALYLLSCTHVLAPFNNNSFGEPIFQPQRSGLTNNRIASLSDYIPLTSVSAGNTEIALDAAIAKVTCQETLGFEGNPNEPIFLKGYHAEKQLVTLGRSTVIKIGSISQTTVGYIQGFALDKTLRYTDPSSLQSFGCRYQNLIAIKGNDLSSPFCRRGDSGSLVYDQNGYVVGLIIGGVESENIGYALPIEPILERLDIQLILSE